jgi:hypothetical protein
MTENSMVAPVRIPLVGESQGVFHIEIAIPGSPTVLTVQLDTGSTGLVLPASFFFVDGQYVYDQTTNTITSGTLLPGVTMGGPATVTYQPSSDDVHGFYFTIPNLSVGLLDDGKAAATAVGVKAIGAVLKTPHMCGVGFGRPVLGDNPFLSIDGMATGTMYPSMLLTTRGVWLGCTPEQAATQLGRSAFGFQQLTYQGPATGERPPNSSQWSTPTGYFRVSNLNPTDTTPYGVLVDTGLDLSMVKSSIPDYTSGIVKGSVVAVIVPVEPSNLTVSYSFGVTGSEEVSLGQGPDSFVFTTESLSPGVVPPQYLVPRGTGNFINTGFHLLNSYQLYFDAKVGQVGYAAYPG